MTTPAQDLIDLLGHIEIAKICNTGKSTPYSWKYKASKSGVAGTIPVRYHSALIESEGKNKSKIKKILSASIKLERGF